MTRHSLCRAALLASSALLAAPAFAQDWPPAFQPLPDFYGYMTPEESMDTFYLPPGYQLEQIATEPLLGDGIVMQWDYQGRLWVVETTFMLNLDELTSATPGSSIVILEDTDGDGVLDSRKVFAEGLVLPRALLILEPGKVIVGEAPNIWLLEDTDGDDVADVKTALTEGNYGGLGGSIEHNPNGMFWNIDNRIYNAYLDEVYRWNGEGFDVERGISITQWGVAADDQGRLLRQGNSAAPSMSFVPDTYYGRSTIFTRNRGNHEWVGGPSRDANRVWPIRPTPGINRGYVDGMLDERGALIELTAAGGLATYRGTALAPEDYGSVFVPEPAAHLLTMSRLFDTGTGMHLRKAYEGADFLTSTEERFRPVFAATGPDGALYVLDLYHGIVQDAVYITNYLNDWIETHDLDETHGANGRVYRLSHESGTASEVMDLAALSTDDLVALLAHDNGWHRDHAQRLIVVQQKQDAVPALRALFSDSPSALGRLHALWTLDGLGAVDTEIALAALASSDRDIRAAGLRVSEALMASGDQQITDAFLGLIGNTNNDWQVQYQLAASSGALDDAHRLDAMIDIIAAYGANYIALDAVLSGVPDADVPALIAALFAVEAPNTGIANAITTAVTGLTRVGTADEVAALFDQIAAPERAPWQRNAAITGLEVVLAGAADPGLAPPLPRAATGSWTVDDLGTPHYAAFREAVGTADAEQAAIYAAQRAANAPPRPTSALETVDGVPMLSLAAEPTALLALTEDATLATRVTGLTYLVTWPGKDQ